MIDTPSVGAGWPDESYAVRALALFDSYGGREAMVGPDGHRYSYAGLAGRMRDMAAMLWHHGLRPGATVAVLVTNPPESFALALAVHLIGCRTAWIAPNAPAPFRRAFLRRVRAEAFVYEAGQFPNMARAMSAAAGLPVFSLGPGELGPDLAAAPETTELPFDISTIGEEPWSLFQTGGTTGEPKIVWHRHSYFTTLHALAQAYLDSGEPRLRHLLIAGTWHVSSQLAGFITLFTGGTLLLAVGVTDNKEFLDLIERERVTSTLLTPPLLYRLLDDPCLASADTSSLRTLTVSGGPAAPARLAQAIERFGPVIRVTYGLSEAPFVTALPNLAVEAGREHRLSSCGPAYADARLAVRDEAGRPLPPGQAGEVWISGSQVMHGYWDDPRLTTAALAGGWLRTGDLGYLDEDGYLYLTDRAGDMVVTGMGATNVYCRPVEDALLEHPSVRAAAVVGVPDAALGEAVHAFVVLVPGAAVTPEELCEHAAARLTATWAPRSVDYVDDLPLTEFGKVDKKALRSRYASAAGSSASGP